MRSICYNPTYKTPPTQPGYFIADWSQNSKLSGLALHSIIQVAIPTVLMDLGGRLWATCCKQATMPSTSRAATIRFKRRGPPQARLKSDSTIFAVHRTGILPKLAPPAASLQTFLQDRSLPLPPASNCWAKTAFPTSASLDHPKLSGLALHSIIQVAIPTVLMDLGGRLWATCCKQATMPSTSRAATIRFKRRGPPQARLKSDSTVFAVHRTGILPKWPPPAASLQTFLQDRSLPLPPASNCWAKTAFPTSASLDHPKLSGLALHSIIQVAIPTVLMDLGGRLWATCCKQATMPSTSRAATIRFKRRGPPQARLKSDSTVFAVHRTGIFPKWQPPCSKSPNFSPR